MGNKVHELGLLLDEEVEMLMQEADCKSVSGEVKVQRLEVQQQVRVQEPEEQQELRHQSNR